MLIIFLSHQLYPVKPSFNAPVFFSLERAAAPYFGIKVKPHSTELVKLVAMNTKLYALPSIHVYRFLFLVLLCVPYASYLI